MKNNVNDANKLILSKIFGIITLENIAVSIYDIGGRNKISKGFLISLRL